MTITDYLKQEQPDDCIKTRLRIAYASEPDANPNRRDDMNALLDSFGLTLGTLHPDPASTV